MSRIKQTLANCEIFSGLDEAELAHVETITRERRLAEGEVLFRVGEARRALYVIESGKLQMVVERNGIEQVLITMSRLDSVVELALLEHSTHTTSARAAVSTVLLELDVRTLRKWLQEDGHRAMRVMANVARVVSRRLTYRTSDQTGLAQSYGMGDVRKEKDLLGERDVPSDAMFGIQTLRAVENFPITHIPIGHFPALIRSLSLVKRAAVRANRALGLLDAEVADAIEAACEEVEQGHWHGHFVVDVVQGGAGTSTNMNANEVIANRALELLGYARGEYQHCHPNSHVNLSQSTNDVYPTAIRLALIMKLTDLKAALGALVEALFDKGREFHDVLKMGRTQLQDAVPMTLGQEFTAFAVTIEEDIARLEETGRLFHEVNLGGTAIGTGINAEPEYPELAVGHLATLTNIPFVSAANLVEATWDTGAFVMFSGVLKRVAVKLSKLCNDLRLLSSGPRCGFNEINLPPVQPGSSIMPGKVNPVIPEVVNQVAYQVIGNDLTVTMAAEAGQLQLNVMEPILAFNLFQSLELLTTSIHTLVNRCVVGITANVEHCREMVERSIGIVTATVPYIGYEKSSAVAKEALETGRPVREIILELGYLDAETLEQILSPEGMTVPRSLSPKSGDA